MEGGRGGVEEKEEETEKVKEEEKKKIPKLRNSVLPFLFTT